MDAITTVLAVRERFGETQLVAKLAAAIKRAEVAEAEAARFSGALRQVRSALSEIDRPAEI